ncbi:Ig-like domain-containing protein [Tessaracoccus caeni]|uniref:Ig-like domain-containing protein n=1 Tax=Tessaracoccus caeni TaxID=3031239 RepID=UPI0023DCA356|nr:Ig-like domain-containing protein [Tessaracoccus caeni]MDF1487426.1 Ig-like domain-containing protein [Tessaracoccus caeni]
MAQQTKNRMAGRIVAALTAAMLATAGSIGGMATAHADDLDPFTPVEIHGESYGPVQPAQPFSVSAPNAVIQGQPIVITGKNYLATDGKTGSVANFMVDAERSGDPNTLLTSRTIINPVDGKVFGDKRSHGVVQANADGTWRMEIPWPTLSNTQGRDAAYFANNWAPGTQHSVRILTGSMLTSPADYQRGISVRFTVVPQQDLTTKTPKITGTAKVGKTLKVDSTSVAWTPAKVTLKYQWLRDGKSIKGATKSSYKLTNSDAGKKISVKVTGSKSGYKTVSKTSKTVSVAKVTSSVKVTVPSSVAKSKQATIKVTVSSAATSKPTGKVTVKVNGKTVTKTVSSSAKGKVSVKLPKISKKGSYKVSVSFKPSGDTAKSTATSKTVTKTLKVK